MLKSIFTFFFLHFFIALYAQSDIPIGVWKSHLAYKEGIWVAQSDQSVFYAAAKGLIILSKEDNSVRFLSREDGLSDVSISKIFFDSFNNQLIIFYDDSNIDVLSNGDEILNISSIKDNRTVIGSKKVNDFHVINEDLAYIATDFGILSFHLKRREFVNTTFTSFAINAIGFLNNQIYAASDNGIFYISSSDLNPADFGRWQKVTGIPGLPQNYKVDVFEVFNGKLYFTVDNVLFSGNNETGFTEIYEPLNGFDINFLSASDKNIIIGNRDFDNNRSKIDYINLTGDLKTGINNCTGRLTYAVEDTDGKIWFADEWSPIKYAENMEWGCQRFEYNSPLGNRTGEINFKGNKVFIAGGGATEDYQNPAGSFGFYTYENKIWTNYLNENLPAIGQYDFSYIQTVVPHPKNDDVYIGSYWNGMLKWNSKDNTTEHFNKDNTNRIFLPRVGDTLRTRVPFMMFDNKDNLWITNFGSSRPLVVMTKDGQWQNFSMSGNNNLAKMTIDKNQNKWFSVQGVGNGLLVFNEGSDIFDTSDDKIRYITSANSEIKANRVHTVFSDLNGSVWVGTSEGPVIFDCADPFNNNCTGATRKVIEDGIPAILLKTEEILSIVADGANRKWLGTRNGIFVLSPSGDTLITKYDTQNSPLLDNVVRYMAFNGESGEMWISSNNGIQSLRTTTTAGGRVHSDVYVFPNPVRPEYQGIIAINGLVRDANVKITDMNGRLVHETIADGGQAIWDGKDYTGKRVASGVYLVFSSSQEVSNDPETLVTKILVMN
ncbi:MAG: hypothetical protein IPN79_09670 [Saprospiraceae bacterium]|nr:hypothetical protein [Saprospiraceae bacterium]